MEPALARAGVEGVVAQQAPPAPPPVAPQTIPREALTLAEIASDHRRMLLSFTTVSIAALVRLSDPKVEYSYHPEIYGLLLLALTVAGVIAWFFYVGSVFSLAAELVGTGWAILLTLLAVVPCCVGCIPLFWLDIAARRRFQAAGVQFGLLGAAASDVLNAFKRA